MIRSFRLFYPSAAQVNADWNAVSGVAAILNKPSIPGAQVNSDWLAASGAAAILNKPAIPVAQVSSDWNATSGVAQILNKPTVTPSAATRALNTAFQISASRGCFVNYGVDITTQALLLAGSRGTVALQYADNVGMTTNLVNVMSGTSSIGGVLNVQAIQTALLCGYIPAGKFVRIVTTNTTGTPTFAYNSGNEALFL